MYAGWSEAPGDLPSLKIVRYARLSCGCTLDLTQSELEAYWRMQDGDTFDCPKCNEKTVWILATWKPGMFDCAEGMD